MIDRRLTAAELDEAIRRARADLQAPARNDVSIWRAWLDHLLPPGAEPRRLARGIGIIFWLVIAVLAVWGGLALATITVLRLVAGAQ